MGVRFYLPEVDGLRFFAFLLVFIHHFRVSENVFFKYLHEFGWVGVDLFFLLSAFLLTYLLRREYSEKNNINIRFFFIRRVLRIWPLYFIYIYHT